MDRVHRILRLIVLLQSRQALSSRDLMDQLGVSRRTLFRDLNTLELAGIPYYHEKRRGYRIGKGFFLPPVSLTVPETLGLMLLAKSTATRKGAPLGRAAVSAIAKLTATVPDEIRQACNDLLTHVSVDHGAQLDQDQESVHYVSVQRCIDEGRCCKVVYNSPAEPEIITMRLDPYALHFASRAWYVIGYCDHYQDVRILKLSRLQSVEPMQRLFVRPKNFNPMDKIGQAWQLIPEGQIYCIELEFSARVASNVIETRWHPSQKHEMLEDGRCRVSFEIDGLGEIAWWICGYADQVIVISPPQLRHRVARMLKHAFEQYIPTHQETDNEASMDDDPDLLTSPSTT